MALNGKQVVIWTKTHYDLVMRHLATYAFINIGLRNGLLPGSTNPLPEPIINGILGTHLRPISPKMINISIPKMSSNGASPDLFTPGAPFTYMF